MLFRPTTAKPCDANIDAIELQEFLFDWEPDPHITTGHPFRGCFAAGSQRFKATSIGRGVGRVPVRVGIVGRCPEGRTVKSRARRLPNASRPTEPGTSCRFLIASGNGWGVKGPCTRT